MKVAGCSRKLVLVCQTIRRHITEDCNLNIHSRENPKSHTVRLVSFSINILEKEITKDWF
jgi:hypothetical protein